jgi:GxxExxY protein
VPLVYKGVDLECGYRIDRLIEGALVLESRPSKVSSESTRPSSSRTRMAKLRLGLLVNFRETLLKNGLRRMILFHD